MYSVIIADDERELRQALVRNIDWEAVGFRVIAEAANGAEALELVEQLNPDLLLTDIKMPFLSGLDLAEKVRETRPAVQIAFISGYDDFSYAQRAIQYNIISYILKPVSLEEITKELLNIREKLDGRFEEFAKGSKGYSDQCAVDVLIPMLMDQYQETDGARMKEWEKILYEEAAEKGVPGIGDGVCSYKLMVTGFTDGDGWNVTGMETVGAVTQIAGKYVGHTGFYAGGRVVSLLYAPADMLGQYLYIIAEEITQSAKRILGYRAVVCVSNIFSGLDGCREAYRQVVETYSYALKNGPGIYFVSDIEREKEIETEYLKKHPEPVDAGDGSKHHPSSATLICEEAIALLNRKYSDKELSLQSISKEISVSPNYLSTIIKRTTGSSFVDLLTKRRIEKAKGMLRETDLKVWEITERCGYNDQHYFSYCFKKYEGTSPAAYRRQHAQKE